MNEVGINQALAQLAGRANASSKGASVEKADSAGKDLPDYAKTGNKSPMDKASDSQPENGHHLGEAVASVNDYVQSIQRDLRFTVDEELERTVIKVLDGDSGEVIRQIPEDVFLELARNLKQDGELQLVNTQG